jgi:hypothetical protein
VQPPAAERVRIIEFCERRFFGQQRFVFDNRGRLILVVLDGRAQVGRLARRIRDDRYVVEAELARGVDLRFHHHAVVARVLAVLHADLIGGEHHGDGHQRQPVHRAVVQHGENSFRAGHDNTISQFHRGT